MPLLRNEKIRDRSRVFGYRAYHKGFGRVVNVHSCGFDSLDDSAVVSLPEDGLRYVTTVGELVLLEDTSRTDMFETPIYEGDEILADVENEFGSWEMIQGTVLFDEKKWGFAIDFEGTCLPLTGRLQNIQVVGNSFDPLFYEKSLPKAKKEAGTAE